MRSLILTSCLVVICVALMPSAANAGPAPGGDSTTTICDPNGCRTIVTGGGHAGDNQSGGIGGGGADSTQCSWKGTTVPCSDSRMGTFDAKDGCYYKMADPLPTSGPVLVEYKRSGGGIYLTSCPLPGTGSGGYVWLPRPPAPLPPSPAQLAQRAAASFKFANPSGHRSPSEKLRYDGYSFSYVNQWLFYWTDPGTWTTKQATARTAGTWATVTAKPVSLTFDPGDGRSSVSCAGPGRAWTNADGNNRPSGGACGYQYERVTSSPIASTQTITWRITWRGSGGTSGTLPDRSTSTSGQLQVLQIQTVVTR